MKRHGMTLIELLLASAMLVVLLGIVWSTILFVSRTEAYRWRQTEQQRTVRNWTQMLNNDFRQAIQDTEQLNKAEGGETIRHFGVSGTATQLRIDISDYSQYSDESSGLRTIFYDFQQQGGLIRRERDYAAVNSMEGLLQIAPEIVSGQFRYFDGGTWHDQWTSLDRKSAPSAIEVTFDLSSFSEREHHRVIVQVPAASQTFSEAYQRAIPPLKPEETAAPPPPSPPSVPQTPQPAPPPPQSPFHSLFGD